MMNVTDLQNLVFLARKGISVLSEQMPTDHAESAWKSIKNAETLINQIIEQQQKQQEQVAKTTEVEDTNVEVVSFNKPDESHENSSEIID